jgi:hypothetical protein
MQPRFQSNLNVFRGVKEAVGEARAAILAMQFE